MFLQFVTLPCTTIYNLSFFFIIRSIHNNNNSNATHSFKRGSLIELANGEYKRIEELRTEDFILSAEKSANMELADSTVVKLTPNQTHVAITFSYDNNRNKVRTIEIYLGLPIYLDKNP